MNSAPGGDKIILSWQNIIRHLHLELVVVGVLLDLDTLGVLPPGFQEEVLDLLDLPGHLGARVL